MLERLRARFRAYAIPLQVTGIVLSLVSAIAWLPLMLCLMFYLDEALVLLRGQGMHWATWALLWLLTLVRFVVWFIYSLLDADMDGVESP